MPLPQTPFYMIRHGESTANLAQYASGHIDVELTETGIAQAYSAKQVAQTLVIKPTIIVHSHLQRARNTARIINEALGLEMIEDPQIAEQNFGDWEGMHWDLTRQPIRDGMDPPNGESHKNFHERVKAVVTKYVNTHPAPVMFVCHGGVFRAIGALYGHNMTGIQNCALHHFEPDMDQAAIAFPWKVKKFA
jgi:broad specificity phosphatase PhoE